MKVLFFTHYFPPEGNAPASRTFENCRRWVDAGHEVTVITGAPNVPNGIVYPRYKNRIRQEETMAGIRVIRVWSFMAPNKGTVRRIFNFLSFAFTACVFNLCIKKPDIVITTSPQFFCGWAGIIWAKLRRVPVILEIRDIWPESISAVGAMSDGIPMRILKKMELAMYRAADYIVCVGKGYRNNLQEKGVPSEKMGIITNGADLEIYIPSEKSTIVVERHSLQDKFVVSYIGTIGMAAGLRVVLDTAEVLQKQGRDDICFLCVGDGAEKSILEKEAQERGLQNVIFTGRITKEEIPAYLQTSDACLVHLRNTPLFQTVLPSKMFEAMACAKPIILGVKGEARQLLEEANAGLSVEPEDTRNLLTVIDQLKNNPESLREMGDSGRQYVELHYNRDQLAVDYLTLVESVKSKSLAQGSEFLADL